MVMLFMIYTRNISPIECPPWGYFKGSINGIYGRITDVQRKTRKTPDGKTDGHGWVRTKHFPLPALRLLSVTDGAI